LSVLVGALRTKSEADTWWMGEEEGRTEWRQVKMVWLAEGPLLDVFEVGLRWKPSQDQEDCVEKGERK